MNKVASRKEINNQSSIEIIIEKVKTLCYLYSII